MKMFGIHAKWSNDIGDGGVSFSFEELNRGLKIEVDMLRKYEVVSTWERICVTLHEVCNFNV